MCDVFPIAAAKSPSSDYLNLESPPAAALPVLWHYGYRIPYNHDHKTPPLGSWSKSLASSTVMEAPSRAKSQDQGSTGKVHST